MADHIELSTADEQEHIFDRNVHGDLIDDDDDDDDEEEWCRMCRGPAEEGRPLFKPCKCSGTIGLTHQDCLKSWLQFKRGNGRCELCNTKFQFAPKYAEGAPDILPLWEVVVGLMRRVAIRWLPFAMRTLFVASLWLFVLPLMTLYIFQGWLHRPSSIVQRWKFDLFVSDAISGFVVASVIIVSFLSFMSFADFLRFHWQQEGMRGNNQHGQQQPQDEQHQHQGNIENEPVIEIGPDQHDQFPHVENQGNQVEENYVTGRNHQMQDIDQNIDEYEINPYNGFANNILEEKSDDDRDKATESAQIFLEDKMKTANFDSVGKDLEKLLVGEKDSDKVALPTLRRQRQREALKRQIYDGIDLEDVINDNVFDQSEILKTTNVQSVEHDNFFLEMNRKSSDNDLLEIASNNQDEEKDILEMMRLQEEEEIQEREERHVAAMVENRNEGEEQMRPMRRDGNRWDGNNDELEPQFEPLIPVQQDEQLQDVDIHVALDELLGLRGPISALLRNLLWLLAFNMTYLGLFAFIPYSLGSSVFSSLSSSTKIVNVMIAIDHSLSSLFLPDNNMTNQTKMTTFDYLRDLNQESIRHNTALRLPDVSKISLGYLTVATIVFLIQFVVSIYRKFPEKESSQLSLETSTLERREDREIANNRLNEVDDNIWDQADIDNGVLRPIDIKSAVAKKLSSAIDCAAAIVKVGVLLFLKMFLFPLLIGIWLDLCTLSIFEKSVDERLLYAGSDLFAATLIHWVAGITFMLIVTVSVLQLREVAHPDLLATVIRPQEPQRDLLGNLLQDGGLTHAKRMILSLAIYALLLSAYVWLAAKILVFTGLGTYIPFLHPKLWHLFMPQLQIPIELMIFHLSMLTFLENYKNQIGGMQHAWLKLMSSLMGLTEYLLPRSIEKFEFVGCFPLYQNSENLDNTHTTSSERNTCSRYVSTDIGKNVHKVDYSPQINHSLGLDPFWKKLHALEKEGLPTDEHIQMHMNRLNCSDEILNKPIYEVGVTKKGGYRVLSNSDSFIRFRLNCPSSDFQNYEFMRCRSSDGPFSSSESHNNNYYNTMFVLPTSIGSYRLRRKPRKSCSESIKIEFWKEVSGNPIQRPPEGWDDLGVGGAEVQGRWAWLNESKSEIEHGVAQRKPFFPRKRVEEGKFKNTWEKIGSWTNSFILIGKLLTLLLLSWLAVLVIACGALSLPLATGRMFYYLLRIPEIYIHDPIAFAIGGALMFPIYCGIVEFMKKEETDQNKISLKRVFSGLYSVWSMLRRTPKCWVLLQTFVLWFLFSPLLLSWIYELTFIKPTSSWVSTENFLTPDSLLMSWITGSIFLNMWAVLCYFGAFRKEFLLENNPFFVFGQGVREGNDVQDNNIAGNINQGANGDRRVFDHNDAPNLRNVNPEYIKNQENWQGENGIIFHFINALISILRHNELDKIDPVILLHKCACPVVRQLVITFFTPLFFLMTWMTMRSCIFGYAMNSDVTVPFIGLVLKQGLFNKFLFQFSSILTIFTQVSSASRESLKRWVDAVHKEAREDRYLVGEILLDYHSPDHTVKT